MNGKNTLAKNNYIVIGFLIACAFGFLYSCSETHKPDRREWDFKSLEREIEKEYGKGLKILIKEKVKGKVLFVEVSGSEQLSDYKKMMRIPASNIAHIVSEEPFIKFNEIIVSLNIERRKDEFRFNRKDLTLVNDNMYLGERISRNLSEEQFSAVYDLLNDSIERGMNKPSGESFSKKLTSQMGKVVFLDFQGFEIGEWNGQKMIKLFFVEMRSKGNIPFSMSFLPEEKDPRKKVIGIDYAGGLPPRLS